MVQSPVRFQVLPASIVRTALSEKAVLCIVYNVDGSGKGTVSFQSHSKSRNCIYNNVTVKFLLVCGKYHLCAVCTCRSPAMGCRVSTNIHQVRITVVIGKLNTGKVDLTGRIGNVEQISIVGGKGSTRHRENARSDVCISGHGLVNHHIMDIFIGACSLRVTHISVHRTVI